ncbi:hypothetical protein T02_9844 [Trichinella nativa]|uniref:Uncharacterized protein n=1 Tax=Trichinella nativa TaxID=6335 RepID=A0A0V1KPR5_9BILA|nr:hypothetical protein T02_9844 [Trichinella nativa]
MIAGLAIEKATSLILLYSTIILKVAWITWINYISVFLSKNDSSVAIGNIVSAYNAYVLWTDIHPTCNAGRLHKRRVFPEKLCTALVQPEM